MMGFRWDLGKWLWVCRLGDFSAIRNDNPEALSLLDKNQVKNKLKTCCVSHAGNLLEFKSI